MPSNRSARFTLSRLVQIGCLAALGGGLLFLHWAPLAAMVGVWSRSPMYSYAYSVPFISAYLIWVRRSEFGRHRPGASWHVAILVMLLGFAILVVGRLASIQVLQQLAFVVNLTGVLLVVFGAAYVRVMWAGLAYLLLMIPIWDGLTDLLHPPFQIQSAAIGTALLRAVGVPAYREGVLITLPNIALEVARSCSGVNYLVAVVALGLPLGYLSLPGIWRRIVLVGGAVVIAALSNGLRVALIAILAYLEIGSPLHGPMHVLHGLFVAVVGYAALFAGLRILSKSISGAAPSAVTSGTDSRFAAEWVPRAACVAAFLWAAGFVPVNRTVSAQVLTERLDSFPGHLGGWTASVLPSEGNLADITWTGADETLRRAYSNRDGHVVEMYVGYFASQSQSKELASFRAADLHRSASPLTVPLSGDRSFRANFVRLGEDVAAVFWYEIAGDVETSRVGAQLRTLWNTVSNGRSDGAVIVLSASAGSGPSAAEADLREIAALVHDALDRTLPARSSTLISRASP